MKIYIRVWVWACYYYIAPTPSRIKGFFLLRWHNVAAMGKDFFNDLPQGGMAVPLAMWDKEGAEG